VFLGRLWNRVEVETSCSGGAAVEDLERFDGIVGAHLAAAFLVHFGVLVAAFDWGAWYLFGLVTTGERPHTVVECALRRLVVEVGNVFVFQFLPFEL